MTNNEIKVGMAVVHREAVAQHKATKKSKYPMFGVVIETFKVNDNDAAKVRWSSGYASWYFVTHLMNANDL